MKNDQKNDKKMTKFHEPEKNWKLLKTLGFYHFFVIFCHFSIIFLSSSTIFDNFL